MNKEINADVATHLRAIIRYQEIKIIKWCIKRRNQLILSKTNVIWEIIFIRKSKAVGSVNVAQSIADNSDSLCHIFKEDILICLIVYNYNETKNEQIIQR